MPDTEVLEAEAPAEEGTQEAPSLVESVVEADYESKLSPELYAQLKEHETPKEEPEVTPEPEQPADEPLDLFPTWLNDVRANFKAITKVPQSKQGEVIEKLLAENAEQWRQHSQQMYLQGQQAAVEQARADARKAELETMQEDDPQGFIAWMRENPGEAQKFLQGKAPQKVDSNAEIVAAAQAELAKLESYPEAKAEIFAHPEKYPPTADGLRALVRDVALAEAKATNPARKQAEQRQQATEKVAAVPKPDTSGSGSAAGPLTYDKLKTMSVEELGKYSKEQIDAVLRSKRPA